MIVCVCNNISDREIRQAVDLGLRSMDELRRDLGVATCCGQCAGYAEDVLSSHLTRQPAMAELVPDAVPGAVPDAPARFTELRFPARQSA